MATTKHYTGNSATFTESAVANTVTSALPAPGAGLSWRIDELSFFATGAHSAWSFDVQESGGTSCWKAGATTAAHPGVLRVSIGTKVNDAPNIVVVATGSTTTVLNVTATLVPSG